MSTSREADLLEAMQWASLPESRRLTAELDELRAAGTLEAEADRDTDLANAIIEDHLTPVLVHGMHSTATDWLGENVEDYTTADLHEIGTSMRAEASVWYASVPEAVKDDRSELREQARGIARRTASQYGSVANQAADIFMEYVGHLVTAEGTDLAGVPSAAGPSGRDGGEDWSAGAPTNPPASGSTAPEQNDEGHNAPSPFVSGPAPEEPSDSAPTSTRSLPTEDTHNEPGDAAATGEIPPVESSFTWESAQQRSIRQYLGTEEGQELPVPGERDPEQDGEAASTLPLEVDVAGHPDSFPSFVEPTPSKPAPSTRAPQVQGARDPWAQPDQEEEEDKDAWPEQKSLAPRTTDNAKTSSRHEAITTGPNPQGSFVYDPIAVEAKGYEEGFAYALTWAPGKPVPAAMTSAATIGNKYNAEYVTGYKSGVTEGIATLSSEFQAAYTAAHKQQVLSARKEADANTRDFDKLDQEVAFPYTWSQTAGVPSSTGDRPGGGQGAADVANVPTPGQSVADYPQPTPAHVDEPAVGTEVTKTEPVLDTDEDVPQVVAAANPKKLASVQALVRRRLGFSVRADDRPATDVYDDAYDRARAKGKSTEEAAEEADEYVSKHLSVKREAHPFKAANDAKCSGPGTPGHTEAGQPHCYWCNEHWDHDNHNGAEVEKNRRMWASKTAEYGDTRPHQQDWQDQLAGLKAETVDCRHCKSARTRSGNPDAICGPHRQNMRNQYAVHPASENYWAS